MQLKKNMKKKIKKCRQKSRIVVIAVIVFLCIGGCCYLVHKYNSVKVGEIYHLEEVIKNESYWNNKSIYWNGEKGKVKKDTDDHLGRNAKSEFSKVNSQFASFEIPSLLTNSVIDDGFLVYRAESDDRYFYIEKISDPMPIQDDIQSYENLCDAGKLFQTSKAMTEKTGIVVSYNGKSMLGYKLIYSLGDTCFYIEYAGIGNYSEISLELKNIIDSL